MKSNRRLLGEVVLGLAVAAIFAIVFLKYFAHAL
jgi:hypothetical protein